MTPGLDHVTSDAFLTEVNTEFSPKWDREWIRYFFMHDNNNYFRTYAGNAYNLAVPPEEIAQFTSEQSMTVPLNPEIVGTVLKIFVPGAELVDRDVFEMGCGVGMLGRVMGKFVKTYTGYDYSPLALHVAQVTSPDRCTYVHAGDKAAVRALAETADICVSRHFFIHNNFDNATWVLKFLRDVVRPGGLVQADFLRATEAADRIFPAKSPLLKDIASCGFYYSDDEISELADLCGLELESVDRYENPPRVFATYRKPRADKTG